MQSQELDLMSLSQRKAFYSFSKAAITFAPLSHFSHEIMLYQFMASCYLLLFDFFLLLFMLTHLYDDASCQDSAQSCACMKGQQINYVFQILFLQYSRESVTMNAEVLYRGSTQLSKTISILISSVENQQQ